MDFNRARQQAVNHRRLFMCENTKEDLKKSALLSLMATLSSIPVSMLGAYVLNRPNVTELAEMQAAASAPYFFIYTVIYQCALTAARENTSLTMQQRSLLLVSALALSLSTLWLTPVIGNFMLEQLDIHNIHESVTDMRYDELTGSAMILAATVCFSAFYYRERLMQNICPKPPSEDGTVTESLLTANQRQRSNDASNPPGRMTGRTVMSTTVTITPSRDLESQTPLNKDDIPRHIQPSSLTT